MLLDPDWHQQQPDRRQRCDRWQRSVLFAVLLAGLIGLLPLAHASPPDQTWIAGSYDADDLDEAIACAVSITGVTKAPGSSVGPLWVTSGPARPPGPACCLGRVPTDHPLAAPSVARRPNSARSPPIARPLQPTET